MGKHHDDTPVQPTQAQVEESVAAGSAPGIDLPPDSPELRQGRSRLRLVRACVETGDTYTLLLTRYDLVTNSYDGKVMNDAKREGTSPFGDGDHITGLRPYPNAERPNYIPCFVDCGEDESGMVNLARQNIRDRRPTEVVSEG